VKKHPVTAWKEGGKRLLREQHGAAAVEFAIVFPLLLLIMMGIFEFGRVLNISQVATDASREAARRAVVRDGLTGSAKQAAVVGVVTGRLVAAGLEPPFTLGDPMQACPQGVWTPPSPPLNALSVAGCGWGGEVNTPARVVLRVPYPFQFLAPIMNLVGNGGAVGPVLLRAELTMRNE